MTTAQTADALVTAVNVATEWLQDLPEDIVHEKPSPDRWSIAEVIGHMIDSACNNHQRFIRAQEGDQLTFPRYDQNSWVAKSCPDGVDWVELVGLWRSYNVFLANVIRQIPTSQLDTPCTITPLEPCTLGFLVSDYLDHLNHHVSKIQERV